MTETVSDGTALHVKPPPVSVWTADRIEKLKLLWKDHSANQIAGILWDEDRVRVTRNAVVGKLHRLRITGDDKRLIHPATSGKAARGHARPARRARRIIKVNATSAPPSSESPEQTGPRHIRFAELSDLTCKFPFGDGHASSFTFCGATPIPGSPYCAAHCLAASRSGDVGEAA